MDYFAGEVRIFGFGFAPRDTSGGPVVWASCNGATIEITQNRLLFSAIGAAYGGDGKATFGLPNFGGMAPIGTGTAPATERMRQDPQAMPEAQSFQRGVAVGSETVTLTAANGTPPHRHTLSARTVPIPFAGMTNVPGSAQLLSRLVLNPASGVVYAGYTSQSPGPTAVTLDPSAIGPAGAATVQPHENRQPFVALNFCIALTNATA